MAEPELLEDHEPLPDGVTPVLTTAVPPPEPSLSSDPPLDQPVLPSPTPPPENYHVYLWSEPPSFVCLRCALRDVTLEEITYHLDAAHGEAPVPTPLAAPYSDPATAPATGEEALLHMSQRTETPETTHEDAPVATSNEETLA